ncbi:LysR substrate-binding domain-containing protein [Bradyrhizobium symbiodeficiens]|uniref:LysR substrate-binding domain-containing protein n=2 Tax=Bradyrhizobium symbiodeficiens TaxID=1404367 RepID=A0ABZ2F1J9_9BRAD|nr:LysR substrate-binding domain-containing protein [Bradyrhizobium symbiodeficiens]
MAGCSTVTSTTSLKLSKREAFLRPCGQSTSPSPRSVSKSPNSKPRSASRFSKEAREEFGQPAGERLYEEASSLLRRFENLSSLVRSSIGEVEGLVSLGMPASLSTTMVGPFIEACKASYPRVTLKFVDGGSEFLREEVERGQSDLALAYEDEFFPVVLRQPSWSGVAGLRAVDRRLLRGRGRRPEGRAGRQAKP